jgi:hypothetical protein
MKSETRSPKAETISKSQVQSSRARDRFEPSDFAHSSLLGSSNFEFKNLLISFEIAAVQGLTLKVKTKGE